MWIYTHTVYEGLNLFLVKDPQLASIIQRTPVSVARNYSFGPRHQAPDRAHFAARKPGAAVQMPQS